MDEKLIKALVEENPGPLRAWLAEHGVDHQALWRLPQWNAGEAAGGTATLRQGPRDSDVRVTEVLAAQAPVAARQPGGLPLLLLYLVYEVERAWEHSYHYRPIWHTLRGAEEFFAARPELVPDGERTAVRAVLSVMSSLDLEIQAENALICGDLAGLARAATSVVDTADRTLALAGVLAESFPHLAGHLRARATGAQAYYRALAVAAADLREFLSGGGSLERGIAALAAAERAGEAVDHYDSSELRAHRFSLTAVRAAQTRDWWWIDRGKVVYVYPFALRGMTPEAVVDHVCALGPGVTIGGVRPTAVQDSLDQDDLWDGSDYLGRGYHGSLVEMPTATLRAPDGTVLATFEVGLRLSRLGNHYVRLETKLVDASPHDVYLAMFRAAPEHGYADVSFDVDGAESYPRLSDLAVRLAQDLATSLDPAVWVITRPGMFHVLLSIHAASVSRGYHPNAERREVQDAEELLQAVGAGVLTNPVTHCVGSLAEWIRYPDRPAGAYHDINVTGRRMLWTCNTTILPALGEPEFSVATRESIVEFVASLEGLFAGWSSELAAHHRWISTLVPDLSGLGDDRAPAGSQLDDLAAQLEREQLRLHEFATETRSVAALIESPSLVSSPVEAAILAAALRAANYPQRRAELAQQTEEVLDARLGMRIEALARRRLAREAHAAEARERRRRARLDTMLAVIAAIGVSGLGQIIQTGYDIRFSGAVWIVVVIGLLSAVIGVAVWRLADRPEADAVTRDTAPPPPPPSAEPTPPAGAAVSAEIPSPRTRRPPRVRPHPSAEPPHPADPEVRRDAPS